MSPPAARCATTNVGWDFPRPGDSDRRHVARSQDAFLCLRTRMQKSTSSWVVSRAAKSLGRAASTVARVVPFSQLAVAASRAVPYSAAVRAVWGGVAAGLEGKNIISGTVRAALPSALGKFAYDAGGSVLRGENLAQAVNKAANVGISEAREQLRFVQMVAPFIPGVGSGVAAALGAANALSEGKPITEALVAAARGALPGGAIAQTGFDVAINLARGKNLTAAALTAARNAHPGGPLARAAFDTAVALGEGKRLQDAAIGAASGDLPGSRRASGFRRRSWPRPRGEADRGDAFRSACTLAGSGRVRCLRRHCCGRQRQTGATSGSVGRKPRAHWRGCRGRPGSHSSRCRKRRCPGAQRITLRWRSSRLCPSGSPWPEHSDRSIVARRTAGLGQSSAMNRPARSCPRQPDRRAKRFAAHARSQNIPCDKWISAVG